MAGRWDAVGTLVDPGRRALFDYVQRSEHPVSREEAADTVGISRGLAAFHLEKLVEAGLLRARYAAPPDAPRGRGRTPKVYEAVAQDVAVSIPERDYELVAEILADAVADDPSDADGAVARIARRHGRTRGAQLRAANVDLVGALTRTGYRPHLESDRILLTSCPFHALAARQTDLVCGLNLEFIDGLIDGMDAAGCVARLAPSPPRCCVEIALATAGPHRPQP